MDPQCPSPQMRQAFDVWFINEYPKLSTRLRKDTATAEDRVRHRTVRFAFWNGMAAAVQVLSEEGSLR